MFFTLYLSLRSVLFPCFYFDEIVNISFRNCFRILQAGYRHIDCASEYGNEKEVKLLSNQPTTYKDFFLFSPP